MLLRVEGPNRWPAVVHRSWIDHRLGVAVSQGDQPTRRIDPPPDEEDDRLVALEHEEATVRRRLVQTSEQWPTVCWSSLLWAQILDRIPDSLDIRLAPWQRLRRRGQATIRGALKPVLAHRPALTRMPINLLLVGSAGVLPPDPTSAELRTSLTACGVQQL